MTNRTKWILATVAAVLACFVPVHGSSLATAAYGLIENAGTPLTQRSILDFTGAGVSCADDGTNKRTICTINGSSASFGGVNVQTGAYTLQASDSGLLVVMNCSGACAAKLYGTPSSTYSSAIVSIGSTLATINLNSLDYDGTTNVPLLTTGQILYFGSDGTNYFGNMPFTAGSNVSFTVSDNNVAIGASGGGGGGGAVTSGTWSSVTGTPSSNTFYAVTDSPGLWGLYNSGWNFYSGNCGLTPPITNSAITGPTYSWRNQGSASVTTLGGYINLVDPTSSGSSPNVAGREIALPSTPFAITITFISTFPPAQFQQMGLYYTDGTKVVTFGPLFDSNPGFGVGHLTNVTTFSAWAREVQGNTGSTWAAGKPMTLKIAFNSAGTTATFSISNDCGISFQTFFSESTTAFTSTPTDIGFFVNPQQTQAGFPNMVLLLMSWLQGTS
jgi:hypothetical protein